MDNTAGKGATRVLLTGGTGLLGVALQRSAPPGVLGFATCTLARVRVLPLPFRFIPVELTDKEQMRRAFLEAEPDLVIHTAAMGSVDFVEKNREIAYHVNVNGVRNLVDLCCDHGTRFIHVSTNAVFDGRSPLYSESAAVSPINYYGQIKVEAERIVQESGLRWAIVRPIMMYGWPYPGGRENPVVWWVRSLEEGRPIKVVENVYSKPLPAWSCAEVIWSVADRDRTGIFHAAGYDRVSLYQFALQTAEIFELNTGLIEGVPDSYFPEIAPRPRDTSFDTSRIEGELGIKPVRLRDGLFQMKKERNPVL